jgi:hypothetical protein
MRALEKDPSKRFQTVQELQFALISELRNEGATNSVEILLDSGQMHALTRTDDDAATRGEVERYERKLRRRGLYAWASLGLLLAAMGVGAWQFLMRTRAPDPFDGREREPNNSASDANTLPFGEPVRGQIARRLDVERSDRDFFRVVVPPGVSHVSITTTALPNMALCTWVYRAGFESPLGRYCTGAAQRNLLVSALEVQPGEHLIAVMQDRDSYAEAGAQHPGLETEPNDTPKDGARVAPGSTFRGRLDWVRDVDFVCAEPGTGSVRFVVEDSPTMPRQRHAVLQVTPLGGPADGIPMRAHRRGAKLPASAEHDLAGAWTSPPAPRGIGETCVKLELVPNPHAPLPHPFVAPSGDEEYSVRVETAP